MSTANAQARWVNYLSGDSVSVGGDREDVSTSVALAPNGDVVIAGLTTGAIGRTGFSGVGNWFVTRFANNGNPQWSYTVDYGGNHSPPDLVVSSSNTVYFQGFTDRGYSALFALNGSDGTFLSNRDQNGSGARLAAAPSGGLYITGLNNNGYAFAGYKAFYVGFYSESNLRTESWGVEIGNLGDSVFGAYPLHNISALSSSASGDYVYVFTNNQFEDLKSSLPNGVLAPFGGKAGVGGRDSLVIKVNANGSVSWTQLFGTAGDDTPHSLAVGSSNKVYATFASGSDVSLAQIDASTGAVNWTQTLSVGNTNKSYVAAGTDGYVYVAGLKAGSGTGNNDIYLIKVDPALQGTSSFVKYNATFGSTSNESIGGIAASKDGSIYITGSTYGSFGIGPSGADNQNRGASDAFLMKFELPTVSTSASKALINLSQTNTISFTLSDAGESLQLSDLVFLNGESVPGSFSGSGTSYTIGFKPSTALTDNTTASVEVVSNKFQSLASNKVAFAVDPVLPTLVLQSDKNALIAGETATLTLKLSEAVAGFSASAVSVTGGMLSAWTGADTLFSASFTPSANTETQASISLGNGFLTDLAGNRNVDGSDTNNRVQIAVDTKLPTLTISSTPSALKVGETAAVSFAVSESTTNFQVDDIIVTGGSLSGFSGTGTQYSAVFTPSAESTTTAQLAVGADKFSDAAGNPNSLANLTLPVDTQRPTVSVSADKTSLQAGEVANLTFTLSEAALSLDLTKLQVSGGSISALTGSGVTRRAVFTPTAQSLGTATLVLGNGFMTDTAGNLNVDGADTDNALSIPFQTIVPAVAIATNKTQLNWGESAQLSFTLSESSSNFVASDLIVSGGSISNFGGSGTAYSATFTPTPQLTPSSKLSVNGSVQIPSGAFTNAAGNPNLDGAEADNRTSFVIDTFSYSLSAAASSTNEGTDARFLLNTSNLQPGTVLGFTVEASGGFDASDVVKGRMSGSVAVGSDGRATIRVPIRNDDTTELNAEAITVKVQNQSASMTINDTSKEPVRLSTPPAVVGGTMTFTNASETGKTIFTGTVGAGSTPVAISSGIVEVGAGGSLGSAPVSLGANATLAFGRSDDVAVANPISGAGGFTQSGTGKVVLSSTNTYTGPTTVAAGTLVITGALSGTGQVAVEEGATLGGTGTVAGPVAIGAGGGLAPGASPGAFVMNNGLSIAAGGTLYAEINGTVAGTDYDQLIVSGTVDITDAVLSVSVGFASRPWNSYTIIANDGSDAVVGRFANLAEGAVFAAGSRFMQISYQGGTGNDVTLIDVPYCLVQGTRVMTPQGEVAVEALRRGDRIVTLQADGRVGESEVRWLGVQRLRAKAWRDPRLMPVCIKAGALGEGLPMRDLYVSPDHGLLVDGHLVHAKALVNGQSIVQVERWVGDVVYWHVETQRHDVMLAEGVPNETLIDAVSRKRFDNYAEYEALYPVEPMIQTLRLPRVQFARQLPQPISDRLRGRAESLLVAAKTQASTPTAA
jgi:autotransporter-associated beta strand protein